MPKQMPKIDLDKLSETLSPKELEITRRVIATRGKNKGCLRASKPKVEFVKVADNDPDSFYNYRYEPTDPVAGQAAYVWRMVAFFASPLQQHNCMPCTQEFSLPGPRSERKGQVGWLNTIVDRILATIPTRQQAGLLRWGQAYGLIGTPRFTSTGEVIYR